VFSVQALADALGQAAVLQELAEGMRRGGKAAGHTHAGGGSWLIISPRLAFLPPTDLDIGHSQLFKRHDQGGRQGVEDMGKLRDVKKPVLPHGRKPGAAAVLDCVSGLGPACSWRGHGL
jgi:hypothetical protein